MPGDDDYLLMIRAFRACIFSQMKSSFGKLSSRDDLNLKENRYCPAVKKRSGLCTHLPFCVTTRPFCRNVLWAESRSLAVSELFPKWVPRPLFKEALTKDVEIGRNNFLNPNGAEVLFFP